MIIEILTGTLVLSACKSIDKSVKLDEKAMTRYSKAYEKSAEAELMVKEKVEYTDKRLSNVVKKKRAIIENTLPKFEKVYRKIQEIEIVEGADIEISFRNDIGKLAAINALSISSKRELSDKELVCGILIKGIPNMMVADSERALSAANNQMKGANVLYSQSQNVCMVYDTIIDRADRIAKVLVVLNSLFIGSINKTEDTIKKNGGNIHNYSDYDKGILMMCVNIAKAIDDIINIPVINSKGEIPELAMKMLVNGERFIETINSKLKY